MEKEKKKKIDAVTIIISIIIIGLISYILLTFSHVANDFVFGKDAVKFQNEIEELNNKKISDDYEAYKVSIPSSNPMIYASDDTILDILKNGKHIIYFGFPDCPWCRRILPTLIDVAKEEHIETIYYYNFKDIRQAYIDGKNKNKVELYENIIDIIGEDISLTFGESNNTVRNEIKNTKKITAPYLFALKDGKIIDSHANAVDSYEDHSVDMTIKQKTELEEIFRNFFKKTIGFDKCDVKRGC